MYVCMYVLTCLWLFSYSAFLSGTLCVRERVRPVFWRTRPRAFETRGYIARATAEWITEYFWRSGTAASPLTNSQQICRVHFRAILKRNWSITKRAVGFQRSSSPEVDRGDAPRRVPLRDRRSETIAATLAAVLDIASSCPGHGF